MALGRKGLTCGAIKGLTVCCLTVCCAVYTVSTLHCMVLLCRAVQSSVQELKGENCVVYTQVSPSSVILGNHWLGPG
ncbi:unnamed protein product, partial [Staurois parvus]